MRAKFSWPRPAGLRRLDYDLGLDRQEATRMATYHPSITDEQAANLLPNHVAYPS